MSQYCDSKVLEKNWFGWLIASRTPELEDFRQMGLLWTKIVGKVKDEHGNTITKHNKDFVNPCYHKRIHCVALPIPVQFLSTDVTKDIDGTISTVGKAQQIGMVFRKGRPQKIELDFVRKELNLESDSWLHDLDNPLQVPTSIIPRLKEKGFEQELPTHVTWHAMLEDISNMCQGIATKFKPPSEEEHMELSQAALLEVVKKLSNRKLVYIPGKAPVFNLLTTTIFRCMYSIQNKKKTTREGLKKLQVAMAAGTLPSNIRSFRAGMSSKQQNSIKAN